jgi:hypothetical protein
MLCNTVHCALSHALSHWLVDALCLGLVLFLSPLVPQPWHPGPLSGYVGRRLPLWYSKCSPLRSPTIKKLLQGFGP